MRAPSKTHGRAKALRSALSPPEAMLWARIRARGRPAIRRQHPIGPYIADFYCAAARLKTDGAGHGVEAQYVHDRRRDAYMERLGYRVLRYPADVVMADADAVAQSIFDMVAGLMAEQSGNR